MSMAKVKELPGLVLMQVNSSSSWNVRCDAVNSSPGEAFKHQQMKPTVGEKNAFAATLATSGDCFHFSGGLCGRSTLWWLLDRMPSSENQYTSLLPLKGGGARCQLAATWNKLMQDWTISQGPNNVTFHQKWPRGWPDTDVCVFEERLKYDHNHSPDRVALSSCYFRPKTKQMMCLC